jgi:hypothetical protein
MKKYQIGKIIRSTVHIIMSEPITMLPIGIGSGCIAEYKDKQILLTVAHVTNKKAGTCIISGQPSVNGQTPLYSVGAMNYLGTYDITKYEEQIEILKNKPDRIEEIDFGLIDFSYATLIHKADFIQKEIKFKGFTIKKGKKLLIKTNLTDKPSVEKEYGFFGRIKPLFFNGTPMGNIFETQETFYGGLKFIRQIKHYYEFELPEPIQDKADFKGTSGAPIMDTDGNLVSLITHGYEGATKIYGIALADFKVGVDTTLLTDENNNC